MTLNFSQKFADGTPTHFPEKVAKAMKIGYKEFYEKNPMYPKISEAEWDKLTPKPHTIRDGARWTTDHKIHFTTGNRTPNRHQFIEGTPNPQMVWNIVIDAKNKTILVEHGFERHLTADEIKLLAENDGFSDVESFFAFFAKPKTRQIIQFAWLPYRSDYLLPF